MSFESPIPPYSHGDPQGLFFNLTCFDLLLIELVPLTQRRIGDGAEPASYMDENDVEHEVKTKLEAMGFRVGQALVERFSRDRARFMDTLDIIKFLCKDLWILLFRKQIDNLKTNHRGVYVLTDNTFRPLSRMSAREHSDFTLKQAQSFLYYPTGIIQGALANLGVSCTVQADVNDLPQTTFQIKTI